MKKKRHTLTGPAAEHRRLRPENLDMALAHLREAASMAQDGRCREAVRKLASGARFGGISDTHLSSSATLRATPKGKRLEQRTQNVVEKVVKYCLVQGRQSRRDH